MPATIRENQSVKSSNRGRKRKTPLRDENKSKKQPSSQLSSNITGNQLKKEFKFYLDLCLEAETQIILEDNNGKTITLEVEASENTDNLKFKIKDGDRKSSKLKKPQNMNIFVEKPTGEKTALMVKVSDKIENVKKMIHENEGIPPDQQQLFFAGNVLENNKTLSDYNIHMEPALHFKKIMLILVANPDGKIITLECEASDTIGKLKEMIHENEGVELLKQKLFLEGKQMENGRTLSDYNIQPKTTIQLELRSHGDMEIVVEMPDGRKFPLEVNESDHPEKIKAEIFSLEGIPTERQKLTYYEKVEGSREELYDGCRLDDQTIEHGSVVMLEVLDVRLPGQVKVYVKSLSGAELELYFHTSDTIENIKIKIEEKRRIPVDGQRLIFHQQQLEDHRTLSHYNISEGSLLCIMLRLRSPRPGEDRILRSRRY